MTRALTETTWTTVLTRIVRDGNNETSQTLASMLLDIMKDPAEIGEILDAYGALMFERQP